MATPKKQPFSPEARHYLKLKIAGKSRPEIYQEMFGTDPNDHKAMNIIDQKTYRWRQHPDYEKEWQKAWREVWGDVVAEAVRELIDGLHDKDNPWRRTQHMNAALSYGIKSMQGDDSNKITVQIEGAMPDIGTPDDV